MKRSVFYFLAVLAFATVVISACSEDETTPPKTVSELLLGKWQYEYMKTYVSGVCVDTTLFTVNDYVDIRNDGKVYIYIDGGYDTSTYKVISDTKILTDNTDTMNIVSLSETSMILNQIDGIYKSESKFKK